MKLNHGTITDLGISTENPNIPTVVTKFLDVVLPDGKQKRVHLWVSEPDQGVPLGTVLLGTGGGGTEFYSRMPNGFALIQFLIAKGWRVVQRAWESPWLPAPWDAPIVEHARGYAALVEYVEAVIHQGGPLRLHGNSGGAAEIAYGLTTYQLWQRADRCVLSGGPPMVDLSVECLGTPNPTFTALVASMWPTELPPLIQYELTSAPGSAMCQTNNPAGGIQEESILHPNADTDYAGCVVRFVWGTSDWTVAVPQALLFEAAIQSRTTRTIVPGAPHWTAMTQEGALAIGRAISDSLDGEAGGTETVEGSGQEGVPLTAKFKQGEGPQAPAT